MAEELKSQENSRPKARILCEIGIGLLVLAAGATLFILISDIEAIQPFVGWLCDDHREVTVVIGCCILVPILVSLGVLLGGKLSKGKGKPLDTILFSITSGSLGFLVCLAILTIDRGGSDLGEAFFYFLFVFPSIIIIFTFVGAIKGYERSDKRERNRLNNQ